MLSKSRLTTGAHTIPHSGSRPPWRYRSDLATANFSIGRDFPAMRCFSEGICLPEEKEENNITVQLIKFLCVYIGHSSSHSSLQCPPVPVITSKWLQNGMRANPTDLILKRCQASKCPRQLTAMLTNNAPLLQCKQLVNNNRQYQN